MPSKRIICSLFLTCTLLLNVRSENVRQIEKETLDALLISKTYDSRIRPDGENGTGPVIVYTNMYVRSLGEIDDVNYDYRVQLTFRQQWKDPRLKFDDRNGKPHFLTLRDSTEIWKPDIFFSNNKDGHIHSIITPNELIRIYPDGDILFSTRISLKISCPMDLTYFPMDQQECSIVIASYGYSTADLVLLWKKAYPVQFTKMLLLPTFTLDDFVTDYCTSKTGTGEYSCLKLSMTFSRNMRYYMLQAYVPLMFMVLMSWIPFWLDHHAITMKVAIWVTAMLSTIVINTSIQSKIPAVSYTKAIDIWIEFCFIFLFAALIQLVLTSRANKEIQQKNHANSEEDGEVIKNNLLNIDDHGNNETSNSKFKFLNKWLKTHQSKADKINAVSRILFPFLFIFFNLVYWPTYYSSRKG